jgi:hypothetical protein
LRGLSPHRFMSVVSLRQFVEDDTTGVVRRPPTACQDVGRGERI